MTLETLKKKYVHLNELIKGKVDTGNPIRNQLIISDAKDNLKRLLKKYPELEVKETPKKEVKETKSKEKK